MRDEQLKWLQYNRRRPGERGKPPVTTDYTERQNEREQCRRGRTVHAGDVAHRELLRSQRISVVRQRVWQLLNAETNAEFLDQIEAVDVRDGILTLQVADPAARYSLRLQWEQRLLGLMAAQLPALGVQAVRFTLAGAR